MKHTLLAGPWVGSIHGELMCWQGWLRQLSRSYKQTIVVCKPDRRFLYRDFATTLVDNDKPLGDITYTDRVITKDVPVRWVGHHPVVDNQKFISFFKKKSTEYHAVFHAREIDHLGRHDWAKITCQLTPDKNIAWVSDVGEDCISVYGEDLRLAKFTKMYNTILKSKMVVGPCNSIITLAALCEIPFVTWMEGADDPNMFLKEWNPFSSPAMVFRSPPNAIQLNGAIQKMMRLHDTHQDSLAVNQE